MLAGIPAATASAQQYPLTSGDPRIGLGEQEFGIRPRELGGQDLPRCVELPSGDVAVHELLAQPRVRRIEIQRLRQDVERGGASPRLLQVFRGGSKQL